jgi:hypothetical protein
MLHLSAQNFVCGVDRYWLALEINAHAQNRGAVLQGSLVYNWYSNHMTPYFVYLYHSLPRRYEFIMILPPAQTFFDSN